VRLGKRAVRLTNLRKLFWPDLGLAKRDLLQYYADVAPALVPHLRDRAMVMKRYPNGAAGEFFFMKRAPSPRPEWIELCSIEHESGNVIDFPMVQALPSLLWVVNLGCIDLNQWSTRCDDVSAPEYVVGKRPAGRVLVDYNQTAWGRTLASIYSVRPHPRAAVSTPVTWRELERDLAIEDFRIDNVPARVRKLGDLWAPLLASKGRFRLERYL